MQEKQKNVKTSQIEASLIFIIILPIYYQHE